MYIIVSIRKRVYKPCLSNMYIDCVCVCSEVGVNPDGLQADTRHLIDNETEMDSLWPPRAITEGSSLSALNKGICVYMWCSKNRIDFRLPKIASLSFMTRQVPFLCLKKHHGTQRGCAYVVFCCRIGKCKDNALSTGLSTTRNLSLAVKALSKDSTRPDTSVHFTGQAGEHVWRTYGWFSHLFARHVKWAHRPFFGLATVWDRRYGLATYRAKWISACHFQSERRSECTSQLESR